MIFKIVRNSHNDFHVRLFLLLKLTFINYPDFCEYNNDFALQDNVIQNNINRYHAEEKQKLDRIFSHVRQAVNNLIDFTSNDILKYLLQLAYSYRK